MHMLAPSAFPGLARTQRAFTIIELIVALGVTAVMVTLMINISLNMLNAWNRAGGSLSSGNQARIALDYLSQDLQSAILKRDGSVWLAATVQRDQTGNDDGNLTGVFNSAWSPPGPGKPVSGSAGLGNSLDLGGTLPADNSDDGKIENVRFGQGSVWLRLFTTPPGSNTSSSTLSAPRAVSYQISRGRVGSSSAENSQFIYALFRSEVAPDDTFDAGFDITAAAYENAASPADTSKIRRPTIEDLIANNVVDFGVRFFERDPTNGLLFESFPVRRNTAGVGAPSPSAPVSYLATSNTSPSYSGYGNTAGTVLPSGAMPVAAEIMVRILTPEGQRLLHAFEENRVKRPPGAASDEEYWWQIVIENSQVYTRRVEIRSTAL